MGRTVPNNEIGAGSLAMMTSRMSGFFLAAHAVGEKLSRSD